jgi:hypothetical protein
VNCDDLTPEHSKAARRSGHNIDDLVAMARQRRSAQRTTAPRGAGVELLGAVAQLSISR